MSKQYQDLWIAGLVCCVLLLAALACNAHAENMTVQGTPRYVCPSATPHPTDIMPPADAPTYPSNFLANVDYDYVDNAHSIITVQYMAQNAGMIQIGYQGHDSSGYLWQGSNGLQPVAYYGNSQGTYSTYAVFIPLGVNTATITIASNYGSMGFNIVRYNSIVGTTPRPTPCCLSAPIYPTPRPTYTPYPTPTLFKMESPDVFYLEDPIYNNDGPIRLRLRMKAPIAHGAMDIFPITITAATWQLEIKNLGQTEFDFLGTLQTYVSEVRYNGQLRAGIWSPSHQAAYFLGIVEQAYYPRAIAPGETVTVKVAAFIPFGALTTQVSFVLDTYHAGDPGYATFTPGSGRGRIMTWRNELNTVCRGEIQYP